MKLTMSTLLVREYDEAIQYFCHILGFELVEDTRISSTKRWVVLSFDEGTSLLLARASSPEQVDHIGKAVGGRVAYFLSTQNFDKTYQRWVKNGVNFLESPRNEPYGKVVQFADLYGNKWDLIGEQID